MRCSRPGVPGIAQGRARLSSRRYGRKPSGEFGSVEKLFAAYDYCESSGIGAYGGGQFELGVGRDQIQLLASLFHPGTPNDVAPGGFNVDPQPGLPSSPLDVVARAIVPGGRPRSTLSAFSAIAICRSMSGMAAAALAIEASAREVSSREAAPPSSFRQNNR